MGIKLDSKKLSRFLQKYSCLALQEFNPFSQITSDGSYEGEFKWSVCEIIDPGEDIFCHFSDDGWKLVRNITDDRKNARSVAGIKKD